ncbi:MAG: ABC transporter substrate-binding protein [Oligoflexia bacterium]|nr:ABC transporter substrate-binding protein [Oligoflexia bacterium]
MLRRLRASALLPLSLFILSACTHAKKAEPANTLHIASPAKIKGLDPVQADDLYAGDEVSRPYEGLLQYHYLKRPYVLVPALAEALPIVSKDGKTYTFKIQKGILFQDDPCFKETGGKGRELTADDFVYSWKRLADPKNNSPGFWIFDGKVVGISDWHNAAQKAGTADYSKPIDGLKAIDRYTLQITLTQPSSQFLYFLAMPFTYVVPHEAAEFYGVEFANHPVGTGPYRLTESTPGSKYVWDRNPTFRMERYPSEGETGDQAAGYLADAGKTLPLNDRVVMTVYEESQPQWLSFMAGKLDLSGIPKDNYSQAVSASKEINPELARKGIRLVKSPGLDVTYEAFNMLDPVVGGMSPRAKMLRQAISLAMDHDPAIELFYNGRAISAEGPIPPGISGYDPAFKNPYRHENIARAKDLLAKAGYPDGKGLSPLVYLSTSSSTDRQLSELFSKMLANIGVTLDVRTSSWPEFTASIKQGKGQLWGMAWQADYPDAENFLQLLYSKNARPGPNDAAYSNPEFDRLYEKALTLPDGPQRTAIYQQMVKIAAEDAPWVFGVDRLIFDVVHPWTKNVKLNIFDHGWCKYVKIDPSLKK